MDGPHRGGDGKRRPPILNFRPLVFCAVGLCLGIFLCLRVRFGGLRFSDFLFSGALVVIAFFPLSWRRAAALLACVGIFAGMGALFAHLYTERFLSGAEEGYYEVEGTVSDFAVYEGRTRVTLGGLTFDGEEVGGKLTVTVGSEEVRAGDLLHFSARVRRTSFDGERDAYLFTDDIRYDAGSVLAEKIGQSGDPFLRLNAALYDSLHGNMDGEEGDLVYSLLTGNSRGMDEGVLATVQKGGIAHIFAVSGLHIGILYAAVVLVCRPLKRWAALPAIAVTVLYAAVCGFPVSAIRAVLMCAVHALCKLLRRKGDLLNILALSAVVILLLFPAEWLSAGFRLSFGACIGIALFSGSLSRGLKKLHIPRFLASALSSGLSAQLFTFPVLMESFGYVSVWGTLLNLVLIPVLPVFYLGALLPSVLALCIPPAAAVFLAVPRALSAVFLFLLANVNVSLVITGCSLGAGAAVWSTACVALSGRVRLSRAVRLSALGVFCVLFAATLFVRNAVVAGCKVTVAEHDNTLLALVRTPQSTVLVMDASASLRDCEDFLARNAGGPPDAAVVLSEDGMSAVNVAVFTGAAQVYLLTPAVTGLQGESVCAAGEVSFGELFLRYESAHKAVLFAEGAVLEFDFERGAVLCSDFGVEKGVGDLNFSICHGIIRAL